MPSAFISPGWGVQKIDDDSMARAVRRWRCFRVSVTLLITPRIRARRLWGVDEGSSFAGLAVVVASVSC